MKAPLPGPVKPVGAALGRPRRAGALSPHGPRGCRGVPTISPTRGQRQGLSYCGIRGIGFGLEAPKAGALPDCATPRFSLYSNLAAFPRKRLRNKAGINDRLCVLSPHKFTHINPLAFLKFSIGPVPSLFPLAGTAPAACHSTRDRLMPGPAVTSRRPWPASRQAAGRPPPGGRAGDPRREESATRAAGARLKAWPARESETTNLDRRWQNGMRGSFRQSCAARRHWSRAR